MAAPGRFWKRLGPPERGSWRSLYPESGQTFAEYTASNPVRGTQHRRFIYLQPWLTRVPGEPEVLERIARYLSAFYGREVRTLPAAPMPKKAYRRARRQCWVPDLVKALRRSLPPDALFVLAVSDRDLFGPRMGFLFGWGSLEHRVAVMSLYRLGRRSRPGILRRRYLALAAHEAGHALSLAHCTFYRCLMNGAYDLSESDARPLLLCPVCRKKLCWNLELKPLCRYDRLAKTLEREGLKDGAARTREAAAATRLKK